MNDDVKKHANKIIEDMSYPDVILDDERYIHESKVFSKQRVREAIEEFIENHIIMGSNIVTDEAVHKFKERLGL